MFRSLLIVGLLSTSAVAIAQTQTVPSPNVPKPAPTVPPPTVTAPAPNTPTDVVAQNAELYATLPPEQAAMKAHVMFLAADAMQGREAGTPEYNIAANYVAAQFYAQGLRPAGTDGSYLQTVPLVSYKPVSEGSFVLNRSGAQPLVFGEDFVPSADPSQPATSVTAPVVFVGFGIDAPSLGRTDYAGVDVTGKIVAFFGGAPREFPGEERAHLGSSATKAAMAAAKGAVGVIQLESPVTAKVRPFSRLVQSYDNSRMTWANPDGSGHLANPDTPALGTLSMAGAQKLFAGSKVAWEEVARLAQDDAANFTAEQLPGTLTVNLKTEIKPVTSYNVAGMLEGSDPELKDQVVVLTAHLDHVGVGRAVNGDTIYNGAMDNAVGIAALIEEARRFKEAGAAPKRSILFLAVTAEEKGLVGSDYFANNPTVPKENLVANVNLDMPIINYTFEDVIAFGAERSSLGPIVKAAAEEMGVAFSPDPMPDQGLFVRSDHYRFVQQGIPSVFLWPGTAGPGDKAVETFFSTHYHQPSDELVQSPPIDWESGVRFIETNYMIARDIANADERPRWNKGDFFGTLYDGYGAE